MCLAQRPQHSDTGEARFRGPLVLSQALYHLVTGLLVLYIKLKKNLSTKEYDLAHEICYLSHMQQMKAQTSLFYHTVSPELSLLAHTMYGSRGRLFRQKLRQKFRSMTISCACMFKVCSHLNTTKDHLTLCILMDFPIKSGTAHYVL